MSDRKQHYGVKFYAPHPNSLLAFLVTASEIIDNDPSAEPWMKPVEITDDMPRAAADWARRKNPMLEEYDGAFRQRAFRSLMRIGITADALANPTPQLAEMVETLVYEQRLHEAVESDLRGPTRTHSAYFSRAARMAAGVLFQTVGANKSAEWREVADERSHQTRRNSISGGLASRSQRPRRAKRGVAAGLSPGGVRGPVGHDPRVAISLRFSAQTHRVQTPDRP